ncbi:hypothetical protein D322_1885 [Yersinia enterocolitica IP 10393]|nr:hypothetical protein D322_1885 [Yersinia enterocolitica IP 10393]
MTDTTAWAGDVKKLKLLSQIASPAADIPEELEVAGRPQMNEPR